MFVSLQGTYKSSHLHLYRIFIKSSAVAYEPEPYYIFQVLSFYYCTTYFFKAYLNSVYRTINIFSLFLSLLFFLSVLLNLIYSFKSTP